MKNNYVSSNEELLLRLLAPKEVHGIHSVIKSKVFYIVLSLVLAAALEIPVGRTNKGGSQHEMLLMKPALPEESLKLNSKTMHCQLGPTAFWPADPKPTGGKNVCRRGLLYTLGFSCLVPAMGMPHSHFHQVWLPSAVTAKENMSPGWVMRRWGLQFLSYTSTHFW